MSHMTLANMFHFKKKKIVDADKKWHLMYRKSQHILPEKSHNLKKNMLVSVPYILRTRVTRRFSHVETVQLTLPDNLSSHSVLVRFAFLYF